MKPDSMTSKNDEVIALKAWEAIEHGLRYEGVSVGKEIILAAIRESKSAARQDTERLDWLEKNADRIPDCTWVNTLRGRLFNFSHGKLIGEYAQTLRAAIDEELAARCGLDEGEQNKKELGVTEPHKAGDASKQKERQHVLATAGYWFKASRKSQSQGRLDYSLLEMENAYNHVENALASCVKFIEDYANGTLIHASGRTNGQQARHILSLVSGSPMTPPLTPDPVSVQERSESDSADTRRLNQL